MSSERREESKKHWPFVGTKEVRGGHKQKQNTHKMGVTKEVKFMRRKYYKIKETEVVNRMQKMQSGTQTEKRTLGIRKRRSPSGILKAVSAQRRGKSL